VCVNWWDLVTHFCPKCNEQLLTFMQKRRQFQAHCNTLQHPATHCNTLQHTATITHIPADAAPTSGRCNTLLRPAHCYAATHCYAHTATHCHDGSFSCRRGANFRHAYTNGLRWCRGLFFFGVCDMTNSWLWDDAFIHVTWRIDTCDVSFSCVRCYTFIRVTWLIFWDDLTHSCA